MKLYYLSYCDEEFLGALHIWADSFVEACRAAESIGESPGGEAIGGAVPSEVAKRVPERFINRLLTKKELAEAMRLTFPDDPEAAELVRVDSHMNEVKE